MSYLREMAEQGYNPETVGSFHRAMVLYLARLAGTAAADLIVDIGAGQGHGLLPLHWAGYRNLAAVDRDDLNFELFERRYGIRCYRCDVSNEMVPLPSDSAAVVLSFHLIEHLDNPAHYLREVRRILKPGASLFLVTPDWRKQFKTFWRDPTHRHPYDKEAIARILRIQGFANVRTLSWGARWGIGRLRLYERWPSMGLIGVDLLALATKPE